VLDYTCTLLCVLIISNSEKRLSVSIIYHLLHAIIYFFVRVSILMVLEILIRIPIQLALKENVCYYVINCKIYSLDVRIRGE
jgi:hypothetical protein